MSNYNSTNTIVLATHEAGSGNTRMLLLHICENGRHQYVIGSYFQQETVCEPYGSAAFPVKYSWDWGHYFEDGYSESGSGILNAVDYWNNEVLGEER